MGGTTKMKSSCQPTFIKRNNRFLIRRICDLHHDNPAVGDDWMMSPALCFFLQRASLPSLTYNHGDNNYAKRYFVMCTKLTQLSLQASPLLMTMNPIWCVASTTFPQVTDQSNFHIHWPLPAAWQKSVVRHWFFSSEWMGLPNWTRRVNVPQMEMVKEDVRRDDL